MKEETNRLTCPACGCDAGNNRFCPQCGALLENDRGTGEPLSEAKTPIGWFPKGFQTPRTPVRPPMSDEGLTILVDACKKTLATALGNGHSEAVLYLNEADSTYWVHTYNQPVGECETHCSYRATKELADRVLTYIEEKQIYQWKENKGFGLCGGDYVLRFKHNDEWIRLDSSNMMDNMKAYHDIANTLYEAVRDENRCYGDEQ